MEVGVLSNLAINPSDSFKVIANAAPGPGNYTNANILVLDQLNHALPEAIPIFIPLNYNIVAGESSASESADPTGEFCNEDTNISSSRVSANINSLLAELVQTTAKNGFSATSFGKAENQVYGLAQCRGDVSSKDCSDCIQDAAKEIRKRCPNQADARIWYEYCFLRYDTKDFRGEVDTSIGTLYANVENVTDPQVFKEKLGALIDKISSEAKIPSNKGLGKGDSKLSQFVTLYALVQCTRDLSQLDCAQCLAIAIANFENFCDNKKGCRVLYSSCYVRYELYPFYFPLESQNSLASASTAYYVSVIAKP